ncbi:hypothetical protein P3T27_007558 [Kitasatospora sp. MAA19]|uniref:hypothetical protein n=1 Tax=unclassified Kitasatospora TaxID=2633591 RepID=UPI0024749B96|nr:hypothetical protein [Kitasatospora sp. MAA19]MDH6710807.1 hypothetical protein [Kitasatospora sp. MAA19]
MNETTDQLTPEQRAEAKKIGVAAYRAVRAEMLEAARQYEEAEPDVDPALIIRAMEANHLVGSTRAAWRDALQLRQKALYDLWSVLKDTAAVARLLPRDVDADMVAVAVAKLAPPTDFTPLPLWVLPGEEEPVHEVRATD